MNKNQRPFFYTFQIPQFVPGFVFKRYCIIIIIIVIIMKKQNEVEEDGKENGVFWQQLLESVENWYRRRAALHT